MVGVEGDRKVLDSGADLRAAGVDDFEAAVRGLLQSGNRAIEPQVAQVYTRFPVRTIEMELSVALHVAARRFCARQYALWSAQYTQLCKAGLDRVGSGYSDAAYGLFPRYRLDQAIQTEIERLTGLDFPSLELAREMLTGAGGSALLTLDQEFQRSKLALAALRDEFRNFETFLKGLDAAHLADIEPLPYRRVLQDFESRNLRDNLRTSWGVEGYWYPLTNCAPEANVIAFHQELWDQRGGAALLSEALRDRAIERYFLLAEGSADYEVDREGMDLTYCGEELFATSDCEWLVYYSHESSISVAGWLADFFRTHWPDWASITYEGVFRTNNLRASWTVAH